MSVVTLDAPVFLLQTVSVSMLMDLILFTRLTPDLKDPGIITIPAFFFLVRDHCIAVEMFEVTERAGISDDLQVNMLHMVLQGLLDFSRELTFITFVMSTLPRFSLFFCSTTFVGNVLFTTLTSNLQNSVILLFVFMVNLLVARYILFVV